MSHTTMICSGMLLAAMLLYISPSVFFLNHGKMLRNIALWLAIFLGLMIIYKNFGPGSPHSLFHDKGAKMNSEDSDQSPQPSAKDKNDGSQGFNPPSE